MVAFECFAKPLLISPLFFFKITTLFTLINFIGGGGELGYNFFNLVAISIKVFSIKPITGTIIKNQAK